ncbi:MAG: type II toxin-antitoxin system RelE/ParE family toxin [Dehalococcoidia bacterium]
MARVTVTRPANDHLRSIHRYVAQDSPTAAARMVRRIRAEIRLLVRHPQRGRVVPEFDDPAIRELIVAPYRVVYRYTADRNLVQVLAVYHGAQRMPASLPDT